MATKILLVEDSDTQLRFLKEGLLQNGFEVETATNGAEAYKKVYSFLPDIIVSDIMMPIIDGYQLCRMIKNVEETKKIPIILLTVLDKKIDSFWGKKAGAQLFLSKSIDLKELVSNINSTIRRYPLTNEYKQGIAAKADTENSAQLRLNSVLNDLLLKSVFSIPWFLEQAGKNLPVIGTDLRGKDTPLDMKNIVSKFRGCVLVLGNEENGISQDVRSTCSMLVKITGKTDMESLNVAQAASILMYILTA